MRVGPVVEPADHHPPAVGGVVPGDGRVAVAAVVEPVAGLGRERRAVEVADPVAHPAAAARRADEHADQQHPAHLVGALDREREEVGTLPRSGVERRVGELAQQRPVAQVVARVEDDLLLDRLDGGHQPAVVRSRKTLGSRKSREPRSSTGLAGSLTHVSPPSVLRARCWVWRPGASAGRAAARPRCRPRPGRRRRRRPSPEKTSSSRAAVGVDVLARSPPGARPTSPGRSTPRDPSSCRPSRRRGGCAGRTGASGRRGGPARWGR